MMMKLIPHACPPRAARAGLVLAGALVLGLGVARAQQFSADIVVRQDARARAAGTLHVRDSKVRIETFEFADGFFLTDVAKPSSYFVRPGAGIYMDARQSGRLNLLFVPVDADAPCRRWQAIAQLAGEISQGEWSCERIGDEKIDGNDTIVYRGSIGSAHEYFGWIDRERRFPLRVKIDDNALIMLDHIRDEPQPASLFEIPVGARKFSPEALIARIKQSDVWVSRPEGGEASRP